MKNIIKKIKLNTNKQIEFIDITSKVKELLENSEIKNGIVVVFSQHTTASININHNEPMLLQDAVRILYRLVPIDEKYSHDMFELTQFAKSDGRSNAHSHCKNILLGGSATVPVSEGELLLGNKQSIFFIELDGARKRDYIVQILGE